MKRLILLIIGLCSFVFLAIGCSENSNESTVDDTEPLEYQDMSGVWWGYLSTIQSTTGGQTWNPSQNEFVIGIITEEHEARLVSDTGQYEGLLYTNAGPVNFTSTISDYSWEDALTNYDVDVSSFSINGTILFRTLILGAYRYQPPDEEDYNEFRHSLTLLYNTTYHKVSPNVRNIEGTWRIEDVIQNGNDVDLEIIPDPVLANTTNGTVTITDGLGNIFTDGTIEIHYTEGSPARNVYDVGFRINGEPLSGLLSYIEAASTNGVSVGERTLVIGAGNSGKTKSFSGFGTLVP